MHIPAIDAQAFFYVQGLMLLLLPLTAWSILAGRHGARPVALWCLSGLMTAAALVLAELRGQMPDWLGQPVAVFLGFGAYAVRAAVLQIEQDERPRWLMLLGLTAACTAGHEWCRAAGRDEHELFAASMHLGGTVWLTWLSYRLAKRERTRSATLLGAVFGLSAVASIARIAAAATGWGQGIVPAALDHALVNFTSLLAALYANLAYVGLVLERYHARERAQAAALQRQHDLRQEVDQHAQMLEALRAERREALDETVPAMMHSIDAHGRLLAVSDAWLSKLGYLRADVIGRLSTDFLTDASRDTAGRVVPEFFRTGRCDNVAYQMRRKDGTVLDVLLSAVLVRDAQAHPLRSLAVIEDVTVQLAREAELVREQALRRDVQRHAQELDALVAERTDMLNVLAHEVRQPLNTASAALQSAEAALCGAQPMAAAERLLSAKRVLGEVLSGLNNTLTSAALLAGTESATIEDADIDLLLDIALGDVPQPARERVVVERFSATRTAAMEFGLVRLALRNLLDNALGYSPQETRVTLRICDCDRPLALVFEIEDGGPGIEPTLQNLLFERGTRGIHSRGRPGSGLGLYIVRRVAELHEGSVEAIARPGGGTIIRLWLPQGGAD